MFVGLIGVGKMMILVKLVVCYFRMLVKKYKVGIIILDNYCIGVLE